MGMRLFIFVLLNFMLATASVTFAKDKPEKFLSAAPIRLDHDGGKWAEKTLKTLTTEEKVGQLFMIWVRAQFLNVDDPIYLQLRDSINKYHVGSFAMTVNVDGPILLRNQPYEAAALLNRLQQESKLPLIIAADFERGVAMRLQGTTVFPHPMAYGAAGSLQYAEAFGRITADEARAVGVHWNFFPDADVNSNPANPIINTRSFGEDPKQVGDLVAAYIRGAHAGGMMTTAKHFPGHGDTATDSHLGVAQVTGDLARLNSVELPPFRRAIEAGVDAVMVAHVSVPALEPDPNRVATTSRAVVVDLLKKQMGFKGIVVTDALDMAGLTRLYANDIGRAAVESFTAGNDWLIIPADMDASYRSMVAAVKSGEISPTRLDESVLKILKAKAALGLNKARLVDLDQLPDKIGKPQNLAAGQQVADFAVTLVRDNGKLLPLRKTAGTSGPALPYQAVEEVRSGKVMVIFTDDVRMDSGRILERHLQARAPGSTVFYVDPRFATAMTDEVVQAVKGADSVIAAVYAIPSAGRAIQGKAGLTNTVSLAEQSAALLQKILDHAAAKTVLLAMGNPYLAQEFPAVENYICTFSNATVSEVSAAKAIFGEIPIRGRLPVTIPNVAQRGAGLDRPPLAANGDSHAQSSR
jgi:beta-N-acetylhexosaminidase